MSDLEGRDSHLTWYCTARTDTNTASSAHHTLSVRSDQRFLQSSYRVHRHSSYRSANWFSSTWNPPDRRSVGVRFVYRLSWFRSALGDGRPTLTATPSTVRLRFSRRCAARSRRHHPISLFGGGRPDRLRRRRSVLSLHQFILARSSTRQGWVERRRADSNRDADSTERSHPNVRVSHVSRESQTASSMDLRRATAG